jgi:hypothetical protein
MNYVLFHARRSFQQTASLTKSTNKPPIRPGIQTKISPQHYCDPRPVTTSNFGLLQQETVRHVKRYSCHVKRYSYGAPSAHQSLYFSGKRIFSCKMREIINTCNPIGKIEAIELQVFPFYGEDSCVVGREHPVLISALRKWPGISNVNMLNCMQRDRPDAAC